MNQNSTITFELGGANEKIKYSKFDISKAGRLGNNYYISFYQIDYQPITTMIAKKKDVRTIQEITPLPVTKLTTDLEGFYRLKKEINSLYDNLKVDPLIKNMIDTLEAQDEPNVTHQ